MGSLLDAALVRPSAKPAKASEPAAPAPEPAKVSAPEPEPAKAAAKTPAEPATKSVEIDAITNLNDAIAVKLGEKTVRKVETIPSDDPDIEKEIATVTANLSKAQRDAFAKKTYELRDAHRKLKEGEATVAEKAALEARIKELEAKTSVTQPDEALKAQLAEYEKEIASVKLEKSAIFKKQIMEPMANAEAAAVNVAKSAEVPEADVLAALRETGDSRDRKLGEILANMTEINKVRFVNLLQTIDGLNAQKVSMLADAQTSLTTLQQQEAQSKAEHDASVKAALAAAKPEAWTRIKTQVPELAPVEGNEEWNQALKVAEDFADRSFNEFSASSQVEIMQRAGAFPLLAGTVAQLRDQVAALEKDLSAHRGSAPSISDGQRTAEPAGGANETFEQRISRRLKAQGL